MIVIFLAFFSWVPLPNGTIQVTTPCNGVYYHAIKEIGKCKYMTYTHFDEVILSDGDICYRIDKKGFRIEKRNW